MSATDELRRMLDERGVEWKGFHRHLKGYANPENDYTSWIVRDGKAFVSASFHECHGESTYFKITGYGLTPEHAIAATLGSEECSDVAIEGEWFECSKCGCVRQLIHPHYCPNCGAKVIEEEE